MKPTLIPLKSIEMGIPSLQGSSYLWGAHHPHCERYDHHLLWISGHPFCLGCISMTTGIMVGIPFAITLNWSTFSFIGWVVFHLALLIPTALQPAIRRKPYKVISRLILGVCVTSYWLSGIFFFAPPFVNEWVFRILVVIAFIIGFQILLRYRNNLIDDPCKKCPLGEYPTCDWNLPRLLRENEELKALVPFLKADK